MYAVKLLGKFEDIGLKNVVLCGYSGKENRGTEAIACSTADLFHDYSKSVFLTFKSVENVEHYDNGVFDGAFTCNTLNNKFLQLCNSVWCRLFKNTYPYSYFRYKELLANPEDNLLIHIGGDTYCYGTSLDNNALVYLSNKRNNSILLWGVSIEQESIDDTLTKKALLRYDKIYVRETLSYDLLLNNGFPMTNVFKMSDPAFTLKPKETPLNNEWWNKHKVIGINLSPFAMSENNDSMLIINSCIKIVEYLLHSTAYHIALIPHVWINENQGDYLPLKILKNSFENDNRVKLICGDYSCRELKYIISKCYAVIASRTHASIAAYSSCIPTLVLGYSIKSKGIAVDLFGSYDDYVLPVQTLTDETQVFDSFMKLLENHDSIKSQLESIMPAYKRLAISAVADVLGYYFK